MYKEKGEQRKIAIILGIGLATVQPSFKKIQLNQLRGLLLGSIIRRNRRLKKGGF